MNRRERLVSLVGHLLREDPSSLMRIMPGLGLIGEEAIDKSTDDQLFRLFRSLVNIRPPNRLPENIEIIQNELLRSEIEAAGIVESEDLVGTAAIAGLEDAPRLCLWKGDITCLRVDAVVNAANSALLGCWHPCHACVDNAIHTYAGVQLREACDALMKAQGRAEETGGAKITPAFNLPSSYVIHTLGPIVGNRLMRHDEESLASCYRSCLDTAREAKCSSIAFCCISTGEFHFPRHRAAEIALNTVREWCSDNAASSLRRIVFNVFKDEDYGIYERLLG